MILLKLTGLYRDGGSKAFRDEDNNEYWLCNSFGRKYKQDRGKLFVGNINDNNKVLAKGTFYYINKKDNSKKIIEQ